MQPDQFVINLLALSLVAIGTALRYVFLPTIYRHMQVKSFYINSVKQRNENLGSF